MNKLITLLILLALTLPTSALAQPEEGPRERPERDRAEQRDRGERGDRSGDRGRPGDRDGRRSGGREAIPIDQIDDAIATLRAMHPQAELPWLDLIEKQAKEKPEEAAKRLSRYPRLKEMMDARKHRPAEFELHAKQSRLMREVFPMVRNVRQAKQDEDEATVKDLRAQLRVKFEALFEVRLKLKEFEIERIREHLKRAEDELAEIKADGDKLIDDKLNELIERGGKSRGPREGGDQPGRPDRGERGPKPEREDR